MLKLEISKLLSKIRLFFTYCNCDNPDVQIRYKHISPKTKTWVYEIRCDYCNKIHYKSKD